MEANKKIESRLVIEKHSVIKMYLMISVMISSTLVVLAMFASLVSTKITLFHSYHPSLSIKILCVANSEFVS